jgi:hypothetical protein
MRRALLLGALALLAAATLLLAAFLVFGRSDDSHQASPLPSDPVPAIQADAALSPRTALFGETVTARIDVALNRALIDPDSVRVATDFEPWRPVGKPRRAGADGEQTTHVRTTWILRCLTSSCLPPQRPLPVLFTSATVTYDRAGDGPSGQQLTVNWPTLYVHSRLVPTALAPPALGGGSSPFEMPWRADLVSMPAASYRIDPDAAQIGLLAAAAGFGALGIALAYVGRPRRRPQPVFAPEAPPEPVLTPIEQALALLEDPVTTNGAPDRRRALELIAAELALRGNHDLALRARRLAWSKQLPAVERTSGIAELARPALGLAEEQESGEKTENEPRA